MHKRILVVDDDSMNLMRTKMILGKEYDVLFANSGIEALEKLRHEQVDLVLLDIEMLRGVKEFDEIPVIFLTASGQESDVVSAIRLGAVNYLKKPFEPQELIRRVAQELEEQ